MNQNPALTLLSRRLSPNQHAFNNKLKEYFEAGKDGSETLVSEQFEASLGGVEVVF